MDSFYDLVSESFTKREEAARNVLQFAREDDGKQLEYVLNRLARGIKSSRGNARQGFATALSALLRERNDRGEFSLHIRDVVASVNKHCSGDASARGMQQREQLYGKLFGLASIVASSRLSIAVKNADGDLDGDYKSCLMDVVMGILQLSREKIWLKEPCYDLLTVLLQGNRSATGEQGAIPPLDAAAVAAVVLPTLESIFEGSTLQDYSPESLHLAFALGMCVKRCGSILSAEQKEKWRSVKTIVRLPKKRATAFAAFLHLAAFVPDDIFVKLLNRDFIQSLSLNMSARRPEPRGRAVPARQKIAVLSDVVSDLLRCIMRRMQNDTVMCTKVLMALFESLPNFDTALSLPGSKNMLDDVVEGSANGMLSNFVSALMAKDIYENKSPAHQVAGANLLWRMMRRQELRDDASADLRFNAISHFFRHAFFSEPTMESSLWEVCQRHFFSLLQNFLQLEDAEALETRLLKLWKSMEQKPHAFENSEHNHEEIFKVVRKGYKRKVSKEIARVILSLNLFLN
eukprot:g3533.t1